MASSGRWRGTARTRGGGSRSARASIAPTTSASTGARSADAVQSAARERRPRPRAPAWARAQLRPESFQEPLSNVSDSVERRFLPSNVLLTTAVALRAAPAACTATDSTVRSRLSTSPSWSLTARRQPPGAAFRRFTSELERSRVQIFFWSEAVTSDCRLATVCATSCCSPLNALVETLLAHAPRARAGGAQQSSRSVRVSGADMGRQRVRDGAGARYARIARGSAHACGQLAHAGGRLPEKVLAEHRLLALVAGGGLP